MSTLDELRRLHEGAVGAPWRAELATSRYHVMAGLTDIWIGVFARHADAALIAAMRNALPNLLDEIERLRAALTGRTVSCGACEAMAKELAEAVALLRQNFDTNKAGWADDHLKWLVRRDALLARHKEGE